LDALAKTEVAEGGICIAGGVPQRENVTGGVMPKGFRRARRGGEKVPGRGPKEKGGLQKVVVGEEDP